MSGTAAAYPEEWSRQVHMCENLNVELKEFVLERILYEIAATQTLKAS